MDEWARGSAEELIVVGEKRFIGLGHEDGQTNRNMGPMTVKCILEVW